VGERTVPPGRYGHLKFLISQVVERERRPRQPVNPSEHLGEHVRVKATVFLGGEIKQAIEPVTIDH